jgi:hypothetical protein
MNSSVLHRYRKVFMIYTMSLSNGSRTEPHFNQRTCGPNLWHAVGYPSVTKVILNIFSGFSVYEYGTVRFCVPEQGAIT